MRFLQSHSDQLGYDLWTVSTSNHMLFGEQHLTVDPEPQAVDLLIANQVRPGDIVVTQDYGVAAITISKEAICITQNGMIISNINIDGLELERMLYSIFRKYREQMARLDDFA